MKPTPYVSVSLFTLSDSVLERVAFVLKTFGFSYVFTHGIIIVWLLQSKIELNLRPY